MNTVIDLNYTGCFKINCAVKFICGGLSCHRGAATETLDNLDARWEMFRSKRTWFTFGLGLFKF